MSAYRYAEERPIRIRSRTRRLVLAALARLGVASAWFGFLLGWHWGATELDALSFDLLIVAGVLGFFDGVVGNLLGHSWKKSVGIGLVSVATVELTLTIWLDITGADFATLAGLCIPATLHGVAFGYGLFVAFRWLAAPRPEPPPKPPRKLTPPIEPESPADRVFVRQLVSSTTLFALVVPIAIATYLLSSIRRDAPIESAAAIIGAGASLSFVGAMLLQLRDVAPRTSSIVIAISTCAATVAGVLVDRRFFDGLLGLATAFGTMLPGAMIFAAIAGWFAATGVRAIGEGSPVFDAIARKEHFVDEEEPVSDEVLPSSTRRLLERVRTQRKK